MPNLPEKLKTVKLRECMLKEKSEKMNRVSPWRNGAIEGLMVLMSNEILLAHWLGPGGKCVTYRKCYRIITHLSIFLANGRIFNYIFAIKKMLNL